MNAAVIFLFNQTAEQDELSKQALDSLLKQDIGNLHVIVVNNGSHPATQEWLDEVPDITVLHYPENQSPIRLSNLVMSGLFDDGFDYFFGVPNDVWLPPYLYRRMLESPRGLITASESRDIEWVKSSPEPETISAVSENTPFAVCIIRKWFYDALSAQHGYFFDPHYFHFASDCDIAVRMCQLGLRGVQLNLPYWHYSSASIKLLSEEKQRAMHQQADRDRAYFESKWGFKVDSWEYGHIGLDFQFKGESLCQQKR